MKHIFKITEWHIEKVNDLLNDIAQNIYSETGVIPSDTKQMIKSVILDKLKEMNKENERTI